MVKLGGGGGSLEGWGQSLRGFEDQRSGGGVRREVREYTASQY